MVISEFYFLTTPLLVKGKITPLGFVTLGLLFCFYCYFFVCLFKNFDSAVWLVGS